MNSKIALMDKSIGIPSVILILILSFSFLFCHLSDVSLLNHIFQWVTQSFGSIYLLFVFGVVLLAGYLSFSKIGAIQLGECQPEHHTISWISMLFCACIGSSILYWGMIEWAYYLETPPMGIDRLSQKAAEIAIAYTMFHWGISGWATYALAAVIIAYYFYIKKIPFFRISVSCKLTNECSCSWFGKLIDIFVIIGLASGVAVSIAIGAPMISQGVYELFGIAPTTKINIIIVMLWTIIFSISAMTGIDKGVKILSNLNLFLALVFISIILFSGSTVFIINNGVNSLGLMLQNFLQMSFYTDPIGKSLFPQQWTIFYWAWWISYMPVMGLFIAKISKGRTIREVILGTTLFGSLGCWLIQIILGGYGLDLQLHGTFDTVALLHAQVGQSNGGVIAIMGLLKTLPFAKGMIALFVIVAFIFLSTTCDSSAYILASITTKKIATDGEPSKLSRLFWSVCIIIWPIILLIVGGLNVVKLSTVLGSIPLLVVFALMIYNFLKDIR